MNGIEKILMVAAFAAIFTGAGSLAYQIYKMTVLDAEARGLKHPKFWGFFALSSNSSGLIAYLLGRRKYPVTCMTGEIESEIRSRKKKAYVSLVFVSAVTVAVVISSFMVS